MSYPSDQAGFKGRADGPGADAARLVSRDLGRRQRVVYDGLGDNEWTAEQIAAHTGGHFYTTRPRLSELKALGLVIDTGKRGVSAFGGQCTVYRRATPDEVSRFNALKAATDEKGPTDGL